MWGQGGGGGPLYLVGWGGFLASVPLQLGFRAASGGFHGDQSVNSSPFCWGTHGHTLWAIWHSPLRKCLQRRHKQAGIFAYTVATPRSDSVPCFFWTRGVCRKFLSPAAPRSGATSTPHRALRGSLSGARATMPAAWMAVWMSLGREGGGGAVRGAFAYGMEPQWQPECQQTTERPLSSRHPGGEAGGARRGRATAHCRSRCSSARGGTARVTAAWRRSVAGLGEKKPKEKKKACKTLPSKNKGLQISLFGDKNTLAMAEFPRTRQRPASAPTGDSMTCFLSVYYLSGVSAGSGTRRDV